MTDSTLNEFRLSVAPSGFERRVSSVRIADLAPERAGVNAVRESLEPEGSLRVGLAPTPKLARAQNGLTARRDGIVGVGSVDSDTRAGAGCVY